MDLFEQISQPCFGGPVKSIRSKRKRRSEDELKEEDAMVSFLVNLARGGPKMINSNTDISALTDPVNSQETKKRRVRQEDVSPSSNTCSVCDNSFASCQALGGHMSSHNLKKSVVTCIPAVAKDTEVNKRFKIRIKLKEPCQETHQVTQFATNSSEIASSPEFGIQISKSL